VNQARAVYVCQWGHLTETHGRRFIRSCPRKTTHAERNFAEVNRPGRAPQRSTCRYPAMRLAPAVATMVGLVQPRNQAEWGQVAWDRVNDAGFAVLREFGWPSDGAWQASWKGGR